MLQICSVVNPSISSFYTLNFAFLLAFRKAFHAKCVATAIPSLLCLTRKPHLMLNANCSRIHPAIRRNERSAIPPLNTEHGENTDFSPKVREVSVKQRRRPTLASLDFDMSMAAAQHMQHLVVPERRE